MVDGSDQEQSALLPVFLKLAGRRVVVVGGGPVAAAKIRGLRDTGAEVLVVAPERAPGHSQGGESGSGLGSSPSEPLSPATWMAPGWPSQPRRRRSIARSPRPRRRGDLRDRRRRSGRCLRVRWWYPATRRCHHCVFDRRTGARAGGAAARGARGRDPRRGRARRRGWNSARGLRAGWREGAVPMAQRRPLLLAAINAPLCQGARAVTEPAVGRGRSRRAGHAGGRGPRRIPIS